MGGRGRWTLAVLAAALALTLTGGREIALTAGGGASVELPEEGGLVALTFDDGPRPSTTGRLLDGLALREIPATFFLVGSRLADDPEGQAIVRRMAAEGHQVGVHTFDHVMLTDLSRRDYDVQVGRTRALLAQIAGPGDYWLRPPMALPIRWRSSGRPAPSSCGRWTRRTGRTGTSTASSPPSPST